MRFTLSEEKGRIVEALLFHQVKNGKAVRSKMLDGQIKATLVEATMVRALCDFQKLSLIVSIHGIRTNSIQLTSGCT